MSNPITPKNIVGTFTWQKLQHKNTWLDGSNEVHKLWGLRRAVKSLPLVGRLAEPKSDQQIIHKIKKHLREYNISEIDIQLLLLSANIIKLGCDRNGLLTEKTFKAVNRESLKTLTDTALKTRGELLEIAAEKTRGAVTQFIRKQQSEIGPLGATLAVTPLSHENKTFMPKPQTRKKT